METTARTSGVKTVDEGRHGKTMNSEVSTMKRKRCGTVRHRRWTVFFAFLGFLATGFMKLMKASAAWTMLIGALYHSAHVLPCNLR